MKRKRTFARTLPCLKKLVEEKLKKEAEEMDEKGRRAYRKEQWGKLGKLIDEELGKVEDNLKAHEGVQDTDSYWKTFSKSVEKGS